MLSQTELHLISPHSTLRQVIVHIFVTLLVFILHFVRRAILNFVGENRETVGLGSSNISTASIDEIFGDFYVSFFDIFFISW